MADNASDMVKAFTADVEILTSSSSINDEESESDPEDSDTCSEASDTEYNLNEDYNYDEGDNIESETPITINLPSSFTRLGCTAHALQLVVKECLKKCSAATKIQNIIARLVKFFKKSNHWSNKLLRKTKLQLIRPGATRWSSLFYAMSRLLKVHIVLSTI